jgi:hypothetical protein
MALIKQLEGTRYGYVAISRVNYGKNAQRLESGSEHVIEVVLAIRDTEDPEYFEIQSEQPFRIPTIKHKKVEVKSTVPQIDPVLGEPVLDEEGNPVMVEVINGYEEAIDETYQNPLEVSKMNPENTNAVSLAYQWLKDNVLLFADFESDE